MEFTVIKHGRSLQPATNADGDILATMKNGKLYKVSPKGQSERSQKMHGMYWGGLVELAISYWNHDGATIGSNEKKAVYGFCKYITSNNPNQRGFLVDMSRHYFTALGQSRADKLTPIEMDAEKFHDWLKIEAGWFDWVKTPTGLVKKSRSINFNKMDQEEFNRFYKSAFGVCWRLILSGNFKTEADAQKAMDHLQAMG